MANRGRSVQKRDEVEGVVRKIMEAYKSGPAEERKNRAVPKTVLKYNEY
ncbi:hypothetical protein BpJC4_14680 [Weizmannia acidilactici]|nr:hypothetical protein BpJC4_14680 [Weizmannia acidilactici]